MCDTCVCGAAFESSWSNESESLHLRKCSVRRRPIAAPARDRTCPHPFALLSAPPSPRPSPSQSGAGPWPASASRRLRKGCPGAMSSTRTTQIWRGASIGRAVRVGKNIHFPVRRLLVACRKRRKSSSEMLPKCHYRSSRRIGPLASAWGVDLATISTEAT